MRDKPPCHGTVGMVTLPIVHIGGLWSLLQSLVAARPFVMLDRFTVAGWHAAVKEYGRPWPGFRPRHPLGARRRYPGRGSGRIRAINAGTSPVDPELVDAFFERYGIPILMVYGATEFSGAVAGWTVTTSVRGGPTRRAASACVSGVRLQVVDGRRRSAERPQVGSRPKPAASIMGDDQRPGALDSDGFLYIEGRADDVILRGGFKMAPETVMRALRAHPAVADAAVAPLPDDAWARSPLPQSNCAPAIRRWRSASRALPGHADPLRGACPGCSSSTRCPAARR